FEFFPNTTSGIDWFLVSDLKFRYMEKTGAKSKKLALTYIGEQIAFSTSLTIIKFWICFKPMKLGAWVKYSLIFL
ncbi:MAG: hypothetical protein KAJ25_09590, partial [Desulfobacula sp.]|nr:hypothetical protein [Desulfobacula sp.]